VFSAAYAGETTSTLQAQGESVPCASTIKGATTPRSQHPQRRGGLTQPSHPRATRLACAGGAPGNSAGVTSLPHPADHSSVPGQPGRLTLEKAEMWQHGHT